MKHYLHTLLLLIFFSSLYAEDRNEDITRSASAILPYSGTFSFSALSPIHIETDGFTLTADSGSLKYDIEINVSKLPYRGTTLRSNMENVSGTGDGVRLLPNGEHFSDSIPALISLAYDPDRIPMGYKPTDIYTYYSDDAHNTTHFTDFA